MLATNFHFKSILRWFENSSFEYLMLFLPSSDPKDGKLDDYIIQNQLIIDRLTGDKIAFIEYGDEKLSSKITPIRKRRLSPAEIRTHVYISNEVCDYYPELGQYNLPALILISKNLDYNLYPISSETDLDSYFTPISIVTSFIEDYQRVDRNKRQNEWLYADKKAQLIEERDHIKKEIRHFEEHEFPKYILELRHILSNTNFRLFHEQYRYLIEQFERLRHLCEEAKYRSKDMEAISIKLMDIEKEEIMSDEEKRTILSTYGKKLDNAIFVTNGADILLNCLHGFSQGLIDILNLVKDKADNINRKLERLKKQIEENKFDIFISCKSDDYEKSSDVYNFLLENGYKPFLADKDLRKIGSDDYGCVIRQIIQQCHYMIVYASKPEYMTTTYVHSEWNQFLDALNSGLIEGKLFSIIPRSITADLLPPGLSTRQFFTFDNYKEQLLQYIKQ